MSVITESHNSVRKTGAHKTTVGNPVVDYVAMGLIAAVVFSCAFIWPKLRTHIAAMLISGFLAWLLFRITPIIAEIFRPFNYHSLAISAAGFEYDDRHRVYAVSWHEITLLRFARYLEWGVKTGWWVTTADGKAIEILDEWCDRRRLLAAFREHLPGFAVREARRGLRSWKEGTWTCFQYSPLVDAPLKDRQR